MSGSPLEGLQELRLPTTGRFVSLRAQWGIREACHMPFCPKCGTSTGEGAGFCPSCGASLGSAASAAPGAASAPPPPIAAASGQMDEKLAGLLCYVFGWVTGIIFYIIDKRPFVRFHAAQSIVVFAGIHIIYFILGAFLGFSMFAGGLGSFSFGYILYPVIGLVSFILWILLMVKAYQGQKFRVPIAADLAEKIFGVS
jgi:uncharacterized membrane protein